MNLFKSIGGYLNNIVPQTVSGQPVVLLPNREDIGRPPVYPSWDTTTYINAFSQNGTIYTIISYLAQKFGNIPRYTYTIEDNKASKNYQYLLKQQLLKLAEVKKLSTKAYGEAIVSPSMSPEGELSALTSRPNDVQGQDSFYAEAYLYHELMGEAFIYLNRGDTTDADGKPLDPTIVARMPILEKRVLPSQLVDIVVSKFDINTILFFRFQKSAGVYQIIYPVDMIHWKKPNPNYDGMSGTHLRGLSPLSAGLKLLTQDNSATDAAVAMQQNQGAKGVLFNENLNNPTPEQNSAIKGAIDDKINNTSVKGSVATLGMGKWGYLDLGQTAIDLQLGQSQEQVFIRLCNVFGIPPAIFLTQTTYENLQQAGKSLLTNKILPAACSLRDEENRVLLKAFGLNPGKFTTDIDATMLPELAEDMGALTTQLAQSFWQTPNEKRDAVGLERSSDPNMDKFFIPNTLMAIDDLTINDNLDAFAAIHNSTNP